LRLGQISIKGPTEKRHGQKKDCANDEALDRPPAVTRKERPPGEPPRILKKRKNSSPEQG